MSAEGEAVGAATELILPVDIFLEVFSYLRLQDIVNVRKVSNIFYIFLCRNRCI